MDTTGSLYIEGEVITTGQVLCEYCFDNSYPVASTTGVEVDDSDIMEYLDQFPHDPDFYG